MAFYDDMAVMALDMLTQFGQPVTLRNLKPGLYDTGTSSTLPPHVEEQAAHGLLVEFTGREFEASSLILTGDKKLKVAAKGLAWVPALSSVAIIQGQEWKIVPPVKEINPAGTPILYELQVRR